MITYRNYEKDMLDNHMELIWEVREHWDWKIWYLNKEALDESYSQKDFTTDTRHYAYDGNTMVGSLSSAITQEIDGKQYASVHIPFIKIGYEHIEDELLQKAVDGLKQRGADIITSFVMPGWGNMIQILERNGFSKNAILSHAVIFPVEKFASDTYNQPEYIREIDLDHDGAEFIKAYEHGQDEPNGPSGEQVLGYYRSDKEIHASALVYDGDEPIAYILAYDEKRYQNDIPERVFISIKPVYDPIEKLEEIFRYLSHKLASTDKKELWFELRDVDKLSEFSLLDLDFQPTYQYIKEF